MTLDELYEIPEVASVRVESKMSVYRDGKSTVPRWEIIVDFEGYGIAQGEGDSIEIAIAAVLTFLRDDVARLRDVENDRRRRQDARNLALSLLVNKVNP